MARRTPLEEAELRRRLAGLEGWTLESGKLHKEYRFKDFTEAFTFMSLSARSAETMNHHPEWSNVYNVVIVDLSTHDAGGVTDLDFLLAQEMEKNVRDGHS